MTRGDGTWDIVTAKFFYRSSTATVWTFSASSTVCKFIKSTFARTSISTEVFIAGIYTTFPPTLQFFSFSTNRSSRYYKLHVFNCCVWSTMSKSAVQSISPGTRQNVLSRWMMQMCLLTYLWNGGLAHGSYYRKVKLLLDYTMMMLVPAVNSSNHLCVLQLRGLQPQQGDQPGLLLQGGACYGLQLQGGACYGLQPQEGGALISFKRRSTSTWY